jgi:DNA-binding response OmpR family regulator
MKILIIEDNDILRMNIQKYLEIQKLDVETYATYEGAYSKVKMGKYDALILDLGLGSEE